MIIQDYLKSEKTVSEPISVMLLPAQPEIPTIEKKNEEKKPKILERLPPLKEQKQPRYFSAIPKGNRGIEKSEEQREAIPSESLKKEKEFSRIQPERRTADIFDRDVIAKFSREKTMTSKSEASQGLSFSTKEFNDWGYLERLKEKIERVWQYPLQAAQRGIFGDLYIRFTIDKKGKLVNIELLRTSGYRMLDDAAIQALKDAQPFWPLPEDWQRDSLTITGHFIYTLQGFYLR